MDEWLDRWTIDDEWMNGWIDEQIDDEWMNGWIDGQTSSIIMF